MACITSSSDCCHARHVPRYVVLLYSVWESRANTSFLRLTCYTHAIFSIHTSSGGGRQIALGADIRLTTPDCKISIMESKWGLVPDMSASVTLRELISIDVAKELTMTGRVISGKEAADLGLVTRCEHDPKAAALSVAKEIVLKSPDSVALAKQLYQQTWIGASEEYSLQLETELQRKLLKTWNQLAASGRNFGFKLPYFRRKPS